MEADAITSAWTDTALLGLSWMTTYLLHSSLLLGVVWAAQRLWRGMPDVLQESLWKTALLGGLLTTTWQVAFDAEPYGGTVELERPTTSVELLATEDEREFDELFSEVAPAMVDVPAPPRIDLTTAERFEPVIATENAPAQASTDWTTVALLAYGSWVVLGLVHLVLGRVRFHRQFGGRQLVVDGELPLQLLRLVQRTRLRRAVRLTHSDRVATPIAFGFTQPEICVPTRALDELQPDELESMLAHELAHLIHRDPAWLLACQVIERVLFVQPLHRLARRRLQHLAEYRCDAWAARHARNSASLARGLVEVARWIVPAQPSPVHAASMAGTRSLLWHRVGHILETPPETPRPALARLAGVAMLALGAAALPAASWSRAATEAKPPLPELIELGPASGLEALNEELDILQIELASLRSALASSPSDPQVEALVEQLEHYAEQLHQRRAVMQSMLPATLDALAAGAPGRPSSTSTDQKREEQ